MIAVTAIIDEEIGSPNADNLSYFAFLNSYVGRSFVPLQLHQFSL